MCIGVRYRGRVFQECTVNTRKEIPLPYLNSGRIAWLAKCEGEVFYNWNLHNGINPTLREELRRSSIVSGKGQLQKVECREINQRCSRQITTPENFLELGLRQRQVQEETTQKTQLQKVALSEEEAAAEQGGGKAGNRRDRTSATMFSDPGTWRRGLEIQAADRNDKQQRGQLAILNPRQSIWFLVETTFRGRILMKTRKPLKEHFPLVGLQFYSCQSPSFPTARCRQGGSIKIPHDASPAEGGGGLLRTERTAAAEDVEDTKQAWWNGL